MDFKALELIMTKCHYLAKIDHGRSPEWQKQFYRDKQLINVSVLFSEVLNWIPL